MATSDSRWDEVIAGRVEISEDGEIGHFVVTKDPLDPNREYVDVVYCGVSLQDLTYAAGYAYACGYHD